MGTRPPQPPAKQFMVRRRASDKELLELYEQRDKCYTDGDLLSKLVEDFLSKARKEGDELVRIERMLDGRIALAKELLNIPVVAVMNPSRNEKTLFWPEDTAFENPIETVPMKPEDYELPLL